MALGQLNWEEILSMDKLIHLSLHPPNRALATEGVLTYKGKVTDMCKGPLCNHNTPHHMCWNTFASFPYLVDSKALWLCIWVLELYKKPR